MANENEDVEYILMISPDEKTVQLTIQSKKLLTGDYIIELLENFVDDNRDAANNMTLFAEELTIN